MSKTEFTVGFYQNLIDHLPVGVIKLSTQGEIIYYSEHIKKLFRVQTNDDRGFKAYDFIPESMHADFDERLNAFRENKTPVSHEYLLRRADGSTFIGFVTPLFEDDFIGGMKGRFISIQDITSKKNHERLLQQYGRIINSISSGAVLIKLEDPENSKSLRVVNCNPAALRILWMNGGDVIGNFLTDIFVSPFARAAMEQCAELIRHGESYQNDDIKIADPEVGEMYFKVHAFPLEENILCIIFDDISREKIIDFRLESERKFRDTIISSSPLFFAIISASGLIIDLNKKLLSELGYEAEDLLGKFYHTELVPPEDRAKEHEVITVLNTLRKTMVHTNRLKRKDGSFLRAQWYVSPHMNSQNDIAQMLVVGIDITEQHNTEIALLDSEMRFTKTFEGAGIAMSINDLDGLIIISNPEFCNMIGYNQLELSQIHFSVYTHPDDLAKDQQAFSQLSRGKLERYRMEKRYIRKDGSLLWGWLTTTLIRDSAGNPSYVIRMSEDITEWREAQKDLEERERLYAALFNSSATGILLHKDGVLIDFNQKTLEIFKCTKDKLTITSLENICPLLQPGSALAAESLKLRYELALTSNAQFFEMSFQRSDGELFDADVSITKVEVNDSVFFMSTIRDISDRKQVESALVQSERKYRLLFENMTTAFILAKSVTDAKGTVIDFVVTDANPAFEIVTGVTVSSIINKKFSEFWSSVLSLWVYSYQELRETGSIKSFELYIPELKRYMNFGLFSVTEEHLAAIFHDTTERVMMIYELENHRKHLERLVDDRTAELAEVNKLLQFEIEKQRESERIVKEALLRERELNEFKSRFISMASHEFRTPLTTIYSSTQLLERYGREWDKALFDKQIKRIKEYVHHLTDIMDDVLVIGKVDSGNMLFQPAMYMLKDFCLRVVEEISTQLTPQHKFEYSFKLRKKLFRFDNKLLSLVLRNCLTNAIKYSPRGGKIIFTVQQRQDHLEFIIQDEGIGIPVTDYAYVFEPFFRGSNVGDINGTGLGMSIIKKAVDLHGGSIRMESEILRGTRLYITIPLEIS
ncbi:MAG: PAS domain S-box protein [Ignavibacteria bacterium]|nr:PAS domain S-box protein [Ignavibacteria bacterium]